jgi:hypothetical protein
MTKRQIILWLSAVLFAALTLWSAKLAAFNWWAAGGPPSDTPENFVLRGNAFFAAAVCSLGLTVLFLWRASKRR